MEPLAKRQRVNPPAGHNPPHSLGFRKAYYQDDDEQDELNLDFDLDALETQKTEHKQGVSKEDNALAFDEGGEDDEEQEGLVEIGSEFDTDSDLLQRRAQLDFKLKSTFEAIFDKYERDFDGVGDEIDLETGEIVVNNGHLMEMLDEKDIGGNSTRQILRQVTEKPDDMTSASWEEENDLLEDDNSMDQGEAGDIEEVSDDEMMEDDLILRGFAQANRFLQPPANTASSAVPAIPQVEPHQDISSHPIVQGSPLPSQSEILAQFGPQLGPQIVKYVTTKQAPNDAHIEPAWRTPELPPIKSKLQPSAKSAIAPQGLSRVLSPQASCSVWAPVVQGRGNKLDNYASFKGESPSSDYHALPSLNSLRPQAIGKPTLPEKRVRLNFSAEDEDILLSWATKARQQGSSLLPQAVWDALAAKYPHHSAATWSNHYKRKYTYMLPNPAKESTSTPDRSVEAAGSAFLSNPPRQPTYLEDGAYTTRGIIESSPDLVSASEPLEGFASSSSPVDSMSEDEESMSMAPCPHADCKPYSSLQYRLQRSDEEEYSEMCLHLFRAHRTTPFPCIEDNCKHKGEGGFFLEAALIKHVRSNHPGAEPLGRLRRRVNPELLDEIAHVPAKVQEITGTPSPKNQRKTSLQKVPVSQERNSNSLSPKASAPAHVVSTSRPLSSSYGLNQTPRSLLTPTKESVYSPITKFSSSVINPLSSTLTVAEYMMNPLASDESSDEDSEDIVTDMSPYGQTPRTPAAGSVALLRELPRKLWPIQAPQTDSEHLLQSLENQTILPDSHLENSREGSVSLEEQNKTRSTPLITSVRLSNSAKGIQNDSVQTESRQGKTQGITASPTDIVDTQSPSLGRSSLASIKTTSKSASKTDCVVGAFARNTIDLTCDSSDEECGVRFVTKLPATKSPVAKRSIPRQSVVEQPIPKKSIKDRGVTGIGKSPSSHNKSIPIASARDIAVSEQSSSLTVKLPSGTMASEAAQSSMQVHDTPLSEQPMIETSSPPPSRAEKAESVVQVPPVASPAIGSPKDTQPVAVKVGTLAKKRLAPIPFIRPPFRTPTRKLRSGKSIAQSILIEDVDELGLPPDELARISSAPRTNPLPRRLHIKIEETRISWPQSAAPTRKRTLDMFKDDSDDFDELRLDGPSDSSGSTVKPTPRTTIKKEPDDSPITAARRRKPRRATLLRNEIDVDSKDPTLLTLSHKQAIRSGNRTIKRESQASTPLLDLTPSRVKAMPRDTQAAPGPSERKSSPTLVPKSEEDSEDEGYGNATASSSLFPEILTPTRKRKPTNKPFNSLESHHLNSPMKTPSGPQLRKCGDDGFRCEKFICFKCLPKDVVTSGG